MSDKNALPGFADASIYRINDLRNVMTPALAIYPEIVKSNIECTLKLVGGDTNRWRPHLKTSKISSVMKMLVDRGVTQFKCATTLELSTACEAGARDVLVAYSLMGANAERLKQIVREFPKVRISVLVESAEQVQLWKGTTIGIFVDVNSGMNRTGVEASKAETILALAKQVIESGLEFRGLHWYDGHLGHSAGTANMEERTKIAHKGYDRLMEIIGELQKANIPVGEVITSGTPGFPCALSYKPFQGALFLHRVSPGTVVYSDASVAMQLPAEYGYRPAAIVVSRVVSHPRPGLITCDAGHKSVSADGGVPTCTVAGRPDLIPAHPSEEHLPIEVPAGAPVPALGEALYLVPRHVCTTVNNSNYSLMVRGGRVEDVERVTARGREEPLFAAAAK